MHCAPPPVTLRHLRAAMALDPFDGRRAQRPMEPVFRGPPPAGHERAAPRPAAALAFVFEEEGRLHLPLTLRHHDLPEHSGQVSLPGGRPMEGEALWAAALREAREEIALDPPVLDRLGVLAPVYIPVTHTDLHVHVAYGPAPRAFVPNPAEVVRVAIVPLDDLLADRLRRRSTRTIRDREVDVPWFDVGGLFVWGATAMALSELAERLKGVRPFS